MHIVRPWRARLIAAAIVTIVATGCGAAAANATTSQSAFALNGQRVRLGFCSRSHCTAARPTCCPG